MLLIFMMAGFIFTRVSISYPQAFNLSRYISNKACKQTISYKIGTVDPRFNISKEEFSGYVQEAADIWNNNGNRQLLKYSSDGSLTVNLIYDFRQSMDERINTLENQLTIESNSINESNNEYLKEISEYRSELESLNDQINYWNNNGGAPQNVYSQLIEKQQQLNKQIENLNNISERLNNEIQNYNNQVQQHQQAVNQFNYILNLKPEAGIYQEKENRINIYFNHNQNELIHTIAHEVGHSIGLTHSPDPSSIMYPYSNSTISPSSTDLHSLKNLCPN